MNAQRIIRRRGVADLTNLSLATIYRLISRGDFPKPMRLSTNSVGWDAADVHAWIDGRKAAIHGGAAR